MYKSILLTLVLSLAATAAVPTMISYQGRLTDTSGDPVVDGNYQITFAIYSAPSAGVTLWTSGAQTVAVSDGLFNYYLGSSNALPDSIFAKYAQVYLGIKVASDPEITPRSQLVSVSYAFQSLRGDSAGYATTVADNAITSAKIADGAIQMTDIGQNGAATTQVIKWNGTAWAAANDEVGTGGGWTDDGTVVRLTNGIDSVGIGTTTPNEQLEITGNLRLPLSTASAGVIKLGDEPFIHNYGSENTFIGLNAGNLTMTGGSNTANGRWVLFSNTSGSENTASGHNALSNNTTGSYNTATGAIALHKNTSGSYNTASGTHAIFQNTTGDNNTASGFEALFSNTTGFNNTASGRSALERNTTGFSNTASGRSALERNTTGFNNTASGDSALFSNIGGYQNTASGTNALYSTIDGPWNTATGSDALYNNTYGQDNTATGYMALYSNMDGSANTASGVKALRHNTTGFNNTADGFTALNNNTTGESNTACGHQALYNNSTGSNNTAIGAYANVGGGNLSNATAIGANATVNASNKIRLGNSSVTVIEGQVAYTFTSDKDQKENFRTVDGDDVLRKIRDLSITSWNYKGQDSQQFRHYGPVAQEFFAAFGHDGVGTSGTPTTINSGDEAGILMIAVQALEKEKEKIKAENAELRTAITALQAQMATLRKELGK